MATFSAVFIPAGNSKTSVGAAASSAAIAVGTNQIFAIHATGDVHIKFGDSGVGAASTNDFLLPAGTVATYDMGERQTHIRVYNPGAASVDVHIQLLAKA